MSCCKIMNKKAIPNPIITNLIVLRSQRSHSYKLKKSIKAPIASKRNQMCSKR